MSDLRQSAANLPPDPPPPPVYREPEPMPSMIASPGPVLEIEDDTPAYLRQGRLLN